MKRALITFFLLLTSCSTKTVHEPLAYQLLHRHVDQYKWRGYTPYVVGGSLKNDVEKLRLQYRCYEQREFDEARAIVLPMAQNLICMVNEDQKLRPHLHNYPFTANDIIFVVDFRNINESYYAPPYLARVYVANGRIYYQVFNPYTSCMNTMHEEPFEGY